MTQIAKKIYNRFPNFFTYTFYFYCFRLREDIIINVHNFYFSMPRKRVKNLSKNFIFRIPL